VFTPEQLDPIQNEDIRNYARATRLYLYSFSKVSEACATGTFDQYKNMAAVESQSPDYEESLKLCVQSFYGVSPFLTLHWALLHLHGETPLTSEKLRQITSKLNQVEWIILQVHHSQINKTLANLSMMVQVIRLSLLKYATQNTDGNARPADLITGPE